MGPTGSDASVLPPAKSRSLLDFILAGAICVAACGYWLWGNSPRDNSPRAEAPHISKNSFNDDGYRLYSASNYAGAEALFQKAIAANPRQAIGYCNLGAALIAERKFDQAIVALQTALTLEPSLTLARNNLQWAMIEKAKSGRRE